MRRLHGWTILAFAAAGLLSALVGCSSRPDEPSFDNPFDPEGTGPDPYDLRAEVVDGEVRLQWSDDEAVTAWTVYHSTVSPNELSALGELTVERPAENDLATAVHTDFSPARTNWYRVQGQLAGGELLPLALGAAAEVNPPPLVRLAGDDPTSTATRSIELELRTDVGDAIELSNSADFSDPQNVPTTPGELTTVAWTLPAAEEGGQILSVHFRNRVGGSVGVVDSLQLTVRFAPTLTFLEGGRLGETSLTAVDTSVTLTVGGEGVTRARLSFAEDALASAPWDDTPESLDWSIPLSVVEADTVYGEIESDFGFTEITTLSYVPAIEVGPASLTVVDSAETTTEAQVELVSVAEGAGEMILSEDAAFADATWTAFADTTVFTLSDGAGEKTIFGRYRSPWDPEGSSAVTRIFRLGGD